MRVGSLNVHRDLRWVLLKNVDSLLFCMDVLLVQEFQSGRDEWEDEQKICASLGGWSTHFGEWEREAYPDPNVCHGIAIFSRYPMIQTSLLRLPQITRRAIHVQGIAEERRQRLALSCVLQIPEFGPLQVVNMHLDTQLTMKERLIQFSPTLKIVHPKLRAIVGGDLNTDPFEWIPTKLIRLPYPHWSERSAKKIWRLADAKKIWRLAESQGYETIFKNVQTHQRLPLQLDGMFTKGISVKNRGVSKLKDTDHRLLWIEF